MLPFLHVWNTKFEHSVNSTTDRARLAEKSARKDEKMLFWPPPTSLVWLPNQQETKQSRNN